MTNRFFVLSVLVVALALAWGCGPSDGDKRAGDGDVKADAPDEKKAGDPGEKKDDAPPAKGEALSGKVLMVTQSQFAANEDGKYTIPDAAVMYLFSKDGKKWKHEKIEDKDSNVFHKAIQYGKEGILTIGANEAKLKLWNRVDGEWTAETLWHPTFGGKHNRLRDFEVADFDGDGRDDLAIATHDQGVVAVVWNKEDGWKPEEIDRKENTFVHEIEIGDLDKDGKLEIFATPSQPNTASGHGQGGAVVRYAWDGEKFVKSSVVELEARHIKEILVADIEGDGTQEIYAALEAQMGEGGTREKPVEIRRFDWKDGKFVPTKVAEIDDRFCRFLVAGDPDADGKTELVAASFVAGIFVIEKTETGYAPTNIDSESGGFEHAAYLTDLDGDGKQELYVADDKGGALRQYIHKDGKYTSKVINKRLVPGQAMVWNITVAEL